MDARGPARPVEFIPAKVAQKKRESKLRLQRRLGAVLLACAVLTGAFVLAKGIHRRPRDLASVVSQAAQGDPSHWVLYLYDAAGAKKRIGEEWINGDSWIIQRDDLGTSYGFTDDRKWYFEPQFARLTYLAPSPSNVGLPHQLEALHVLRDASTPGVAWLDELAAEKVGKLSCRQFVELATDYKNHIWVDRAKGRIVKVAYERPRPQGWLITDLAERDEEPVPERLEPPKAKVVRDVTRAQDADPSIASGSFKGFLYRVCKPEMNRFGAVLMRIGVKAPSQIPTDLPAFDVVDSEGKPLKHEVSTDGAQRSNADGMFYTVNEFWPIGKQQPKYLELSTPSGKAKVRIALGLAGPTCTWTPAFALRAGSQPLQTDLHGYWESLQLQRNIAQFGVQQSHQAIIGGGNYLRIPVENLDNRYPEFMRLMHECMEYSALCRGLGGQGEGTGSALYESYRMMSRVGLQDRARDVLRTAWPIVSPSESGRMHGDGFAVIYTAIHQEGIEKELNAYR